MEIKARKFWKVGRSVIEGRSAGGQITWKGSAGPRREIFLVRVGKDAARQVIGTKADAVRTLKELQEGLTSGSYQPADKKVRFDTFLTRHYLPWKHPALKPHTYGLYESIVTKNVVPGLGRHRLDQLTTVLIQTWVDGLWDLGLAPKTVKERYGQVRAPLRWAVTLGLLRTNPAEGVILRRRTKDWWYRSEADAGRSEEDERGVDMSRVWSAAEMQAFASKAPHDDEMTRWVRLGLRGGFRPGEQCALQWGDINFDTGSVSVRRSVIEMDRGRLEEFGRWTLSGGKTGSRDVVLPPDALLVLKEQRAHVDQLVRTGAITKDGGRFVFPSRGGKKGFTNPATVKDRLRHLVLGRKSRGGVALDGVRYISPYGLRHSHATDLLRHGWSIWSVAKRLGTSALMIEKHYGHLLPDIQAGRMTEMTPLPAA